jgi:hypothetical protein
MSKDQKIVVGCLVGVAVSLLIVGVVSGTFIRHVIQILPILVTVVWVAQRPTWGSYAAMPIFIFWVLIVVLICLYLLGISRIANGHYTIIEIVMTVFIALFSSAGVPICRRLGRSSAVTGRVVAFGVFGALQFSAMWISFLVRVPKV